jgi:glyoxylase-like metal-dependent hydrolase (beta-lactamase superfamily II)
MAEEMWRHIRGRTWCIDGHITIPVYLLNEREAVLLDSGYADRDRPILEALLGQKGLRVRAILGTHSHNDHNGNHAYFQKTHGAEIILRDIEAAVVSDFSFLTAAYFPGTAEELARELPHLLVKPDRTFSCLDQAVQIDGESFSLIPLPGHTPGHIGIVTPDQVFYVGDTLLSSQAMRRAKLPSTIDWRQDLESKKRLRSTDYQDYILAHSGVYKSIQALITENILDRERRTAEILEWLQERDYWTQSEVEQLLRKKLQVRSTSFMGQIIFQRNAMCVMEYLVNTDSVSKELREETACYTVIHKKNVL